MRVRLLAALLLFITFSQSELIDSSVQRQIQRLEGQIDTLNILLDTECPTRVASSDGNSTISLEVVKLHYQELVRELIKCRESTSKSDQANKMTTEKPTTTQKVITPVDCQQLHENGIRTPGIYTLYPKGYDSFEARCDFDAAHGWTVIQRRQDNEDFYLYWADYKTGFGHLKGSFWLGNDNIHALTRTNKKLNVFLRRYDGAEASASYTTFVIDDEINKYKLTISGYSGNATDSLRYHNGMYFTTRDRDNDGWTSRYIGTFNCAEKHEGGWWYNACYESNLNGIYCTSSGAADSTCAIWQGSFGGGSNGKDSHSLTKIVMRVTRD